MRASQLGVYTVYVGTISLIGQAFGTSIQTTPRDDDISADVAALLSLQLGKARYCGRGLLYVPD